MEKITRVEFYKEIASGSTIFIYANFRENDISTEKLKELLLIQMDNIKSGKIGKKRTVVENRASFIKFDDDSYSYKNDKGWTCGKFDVDIYTCYVKKFTDESEFGNYYKYCLYLKEMEN